MKENKCFIRAIGSFEYKDYPVMSYDAAVSKLKKLVKSCMKENNCQEWDDFDMDYEPGDESAVLQAEEFYQAYFIVPVIDGDGTLDELNRIIELCDGADYETARYQVTLDDCGVYDYIISIRDTVNRLISRCEEGKL